MNKATVVATILLISTIIVIGIQWSQLNTTRNLLYLTASTLEITKTQLGITETELTTTEEHLNATKKQLFETEMRLGITENKLADTENQLQTAKTQLSTTKNQLENTESQLEMAKNEQLQMRNQYYDLEEQVNLRVAKAEDSQKFITPYNPVVSAKAEEITGGYSQDVNEIWRDYKKLYNWVVKNIEYSHDSYSPIIPEMLGGDLAWVQECWRMPAETLEDETGDCEDMAVLLASLMLSYNKENYDVWALGIKSDDKGHLAVAFPVAGDNLVILDPAGNYYTGYQTGRLQSYDVSKAVSDWLSHLSKKMPDAQIDKAFSNDLYREFFSTDEFINWVID